MMAVSATTASALPRMVAAICVAALPKTAGAFARAYDVRHAPADIKVKTDVREAVTVVEVAALGLSTDRILKKVEDAAARMAVRGETNYLTTAVKHMQNHKALVLAGIAFTASALAETLSRVVIGPNDPYKQLTTVSKPSATVALNPTEPSRACKSQARKAQPIPFASRGNSAPVTNPFQFASNGASPFAQPVFSL